MTNVKAFSAFAIEVERRFDQKRKEKIPYYDCQTPYSYWKKFRTTDGAREFLTKYSNLYFDFLQLQSEPGPRAIMYDVDPQGSFSLNREWKKLVEEFPDRFMLSSDINASIFGRYDETIARNRKVLLKEVKKDVAERIAYKNAWKLMTGEDWVD